MKRPILLIGGLIIGGAMLATLSGGGTVDRLVGKAMLGAMAGALFGAVAGMVWVVRSGWRPSHLSQTARALVSVWILWPFAASSWMMVVRGWDWTDLFSDNPWAMILPPMVVTGVAVSVKWVRAASADQKA